MVELNGRLFKVVSSSGSTLGMADVDGVTGIDTTNYNTFTSGSLQKVTLGTSITGVQDFSFGGGDIKTVDTTTVHDLQDTQIVVGANAMSADMTMQWDPSSAAQQAMIAAFQTRANKGFKILWPDGAFALWYGTVGYTGAPAAASRASPRRRPRSPCSAPSPSARPDRENRRSLPLSAFRESTVEAGGHVFTLRRPAALDVVRARAAGGHRPRLRLRLRRRLEPQGIRPAARRRPRAGGLRRGAL